MQFSDLGLCRELLDAVTALGYTSPSAIQAQAIPAVLAGRDIMGAAQTGTGKTAGFTLPLLQLLNSGPGAGANQVRALVLTPTRELAAQVADSVANYGRNLPLRSVVAYGGVSINPQMKALRRGADVLVATPGRLMDLYRQNAVKFSQLEILVLDEADRMLDMGFIHDIKRIINLLPAKRQNLLFSATFSDEIRALAKGLVHNPLEIDVAPRNTTVERVRQTVVPVDKGRKAELLIHLVQANHWDQVLVFSRTKHGANKLASQLQRAGIEAAAIHGNKSQGARTRALSDFKAHKIQVLVATDIAARGIDITRLPHVINFDLPNVAEDYVHRIGRTGRADASGEALSLVSSDEAKQLFAIERFTGQVIPREVLDRFAPQQTLPPSKLDKRPQKPKKPKKKSAVGEGRGARRDNENNAGSSAARREQTASTRDVANRDHRQSSSARTDDNTRRPRRRKAQSQRRVA